MASRVPPEYNNESGRYWPRHQRHHYILSQIWHCDGSCDDISTTSKMTHHDTMWWHCRLPCGVKLMRTYLRIFCRIAHQPTLAPPCVDSFIDRPRISVDNWITADQRADSFFLPGRYHIYFMHSVLFRATQIHFLKSVRLSPSHHHNINCDTRSVFAKDARPWPSQSVSVWSVCILSRIDCGSQCSSNRRRTIQSIDVPLAPCHARRQMSPYCCCCCCWRSREAIPNLSCPRAFAVAVIIGDVVVSVGT
jgi:hypothetical protein